MFVGSLPLSVRVCLRVCACVSGPPSGLPLRACGYTVSLAREGHFRLFVKWLVSWLVEYHLIHTSGGCASLTSDTRALTLASNYHHHHYYIAMSREHKYDAYRYRLGDISDSGSSDPDLTGSLLRHLQAINISIVILRSIYQSINQSIYLSIYLQTTHLS